MPHRRRPRGNAASIAMLRKKMQETCKGSKKNNTSCNNTKDSKNRSNSASGSKSTNEKKSHSKKSEKSIPKSKHLPKLPQLLAKKTSFSFRFKKPSVGPDSIRAPKKAPCCDQEQLEQQPNPDQHSFTDERESFDDEELTCDIESDQESFHESTFEVSGKESFCNLLQNNSFGPLSDQVLLSDEEPLKASLCDLGPLCDQGPLCDLGPLGDLGPLCDQGSFSDPETICYRAQDLIDLNDQMPPFNEVPSFDEEQTYNLEAISKLPSYIIDPKYAQDQEPEAIKKPINDDYSPESSDGQGSSPKAMPNDTFAFMFGQRATDWELKLFPELYGRMPTLPSFSDIFGQPSYDLTRTATAATFQNEGIRSNADGMFTSIPGTMITDQFGMLGLLAAIRTTHTHPETTRLVFGEDLTKLGLDLAAPGDIYVNFNGPFTTKPPQEQPMQMQQEKASEEEELQQDFAYMQEEEQETTTDSA